MISEAFDKLDASRADDAAALFAALAHPVRLRIVCGLLDGQCTVGPMTECLGMSQAYVSRHLAILRRAGVVEQVPDGRHRVYRVVHPAVRPIVEMLVSDLNLQRSLP